MRIFLRCFQPALYSLNQANPAERLGLSCPIRVTIATAVFEVRVQLIGMSFDNPSRRASPWTTLKLTVKTKSLRFVCFCQSVSARQQVPAIQSHAHTCDFPVLAIRRRGGKSFGDANERNAQRGAVCQPVYRRCGEMVRTTQ